jgi:hypothetical protein
VSNGKNILREKSYSFALEIIRLYKELSEQKKEFVLSKQLLRSGTSIGANVREAEFAQSKSDSSHSFKLFAKERTPLHSGILPAKVLSSSLSYTATSKALSI